MCAEQVSVIGAGDMGHGIAEVLAIGGYQVRLYDIKQEFLDKAIKRILKSLKILRRKRKIKNETPQQILERIETTLNLGDAVTNSSVIFEAAPEVKELKADLYNDMEPCLIDGAIIATNTSYMSIEELSKSVKNPENFIGCHYFNPVVMQKVVELNYTPETSENTIQSLEQIMDTIGYKHVRVKDSPGFVLNRIYIAPQVLICKLYENSIIKPDEIDAMMKNKGLPMGAFETMDFVGLDITLHGMNQMGKSLNPEYGAPKWLIDLVEAGKLGKKTGNGIYDWSGGKAEIDLTQKTNVLDTLDLLIMEINEAMKLLEEGIVKTPDDIDTIMKLGSGNPLSIFGLLKGVGKEKVITRCKRFAEMLNMEMFKPSDRLLKWEN